MNFNQEMQRAAEGGEERNKTLLMSSARYPFQIVLMKEPSGRLSAPQIVRGTWTKNGRLNITSPDCAGSANGLNLNISHIVQLCDLCKETVKIQSARTRTLCS